MSQLSGFLSFVGSYFELLKPRVMLLVVFTGMVGMLISPGYIHPFLAILTIVCIALGGGGAGAINMWYDQDIDAIMSRTQKRPTVTGVVSLNSALIFGVVVSLISVFCMAVAVNYLSALLLLCAILFYVFIYTIWLKRITVYNIVIGGLVGSFPPIIGSAAVSASISLESVLLAIIVFFWNPPHFWALSLFWSDDYKKANIPMMPLVYGKKKTKIHILIYTLLLCAVSLLPAFLGVFGSVYLFSSLVLNALFLYSAIKLFIVRDDYKAAKSMFIYSIFYLFLLFLVVVIDYCWR